MTTKHTLGPWHSKELSYNHESGFAVFRTEEKENGIRTFRIDNKGEFSKEDAKLIAAAPELLEALKVLHRVVKNEYHGLDKAMIRAEQVITKAEGVQS